MKIKIIYPMYFIVPIIKRYEGTRLGRQELYAELLDDNPNALWKRNYWTN
jgi:phage terminase large subunit-like protein